MNWLVLILIAAFFSATATAAQTTSATPEPVAAVVPVFDCFHINFAWGFRMGGRFIASDGTIYQYDKTKPAWLPHAIVENGERYLTQADLVGKYAGRTKAGNVLPSELDLQRGSIEGAASGKMVEDGPRANDAGKSSCHAYLHDPAKGRYRDVDLGRDAGVSDAPMRNDSAQARALIIWLKSIGVAR